MGEDGWGMRTNGVKFYDLELDPKGFEKCKRLLAVWAVGFGEDYHSVVVDGGLDGGFEGRHVGRWGGGEEAV